jgi:hypothetical protein
MDFIKDLIKEYKSTIYWVAVINVILVFHNARDAFLYESTNFENDTTFIFSLVKKFNEYGCKLKITSDEFKYPRFFVYKENSWIDKDIHGWMDAQIQHARGGTASIYSDEFISPYPGPKGRRTKQP